MEAIRVLKKYYNNELIKLKAFFCESNKVEASPNLLNPKWLVR